MRGKNDLVWINLCPLRVLWQWVVVLVEKGVGEYLDLGTGERRLADNAHQLAHVHTATITS